ncbi:MAG: flavin reductase family protein [Burkholderiales bacterium]
MTEFDPATLDFMTQYKLISSTVLPRPISLVTTLGPEGPNAAPFSFFNLCAVDPPMLMFSMAPKSATALKDTIRNIERLPEFVVHTVDEPNVHKMNLCSAEYPYGVNELERAGFTTAPSKRVQPPRIIDCPAQFECKLVQILTLGRRPYKMVIGEIVYMHYRDGLVDTARHYVDVPKLRAMGRMEGADMFVRATDRFAVPRPVLPPDQQSKD